MAYYKILNTLPELNINHTACIAGASLIQELESILQKTGFENIHIKPKPESKEFIRDWMPGSRIEEYVVSATIEAKKPRA